MAVPRVGWQWPRVGWRAWGLRINLDLEWAFPPQHTRAHTHTRIHTQYTQHTAHMLTWATTTSYDPLNNIHITRCACGPLLSRPPHTNTSPSTHRDTHTNTHKRSHTTAGVRGYGAHGVGQRPRRRQRGVQDLREGGPECTLWLPGGRALVLDLGCSCAGMLRAACWV